ncbi:SO_0444 family Cu/Zn efflux transporter [Gallaecimonas sp. GXIMD4217]|uniref:SO_0444 family Cu/Zn efflux transporter n=1 Tax=Gallaecimonas sp. GXIMD4217 TaxID=3131927 RepID=UPI00311AFEF4
MTLLTNFWELFLDAAPWLLLGYLAAALIKLLIPSDWLGRHLGGEGLWPTVKAALFGAPLPLCSCGVLPAAMGLRRAGASRSATVSFLVSTPETGVDSVAVSYGLLGPLLAIIRPLAAVTSAISAGLLAGRQNGGKVAAPAPAPRCAKQACGGDRPKSKWRQGLRFAAVDLVDDSAKWLAIGLFFAALVVTYVPQDFLTQWGGGLVAMVVMVLIGIPMYICATASTPIAAGLLLAGVSPGAVLVFLLAGPATNAAALGLVRQELGMRALWAYLAGVIVPAIAFGYLTNTLAGLWPDGIITRAGEHELLPLWLSLGSGLVLAALMLASFYRQLRGRG